MKEKESYPKKKVDLSDHWEMGYSPNRPSETMKEIHGSDWNARPGKDRATPHKKINECDH